MCVLLILKHLLEFPSLEWHRHGAEAATNVASDTHLAGDDTIGSIQSIQLIDLFTTFLLGQYATLCPLFFGDFLFKKNGGEDT